MQKSVAASEPMKFPIYLMRGETIELDGRVYIIPEPVACQNVRELVVFLYEKGVKPLGGFPPRAVPHSPSVNLAG